MRIALATFCLAGILMSMAAPAHSQVKQYCKAMADGVKNQYLADTGDGKGGALVLANSSCGKDGDGEWRWRNISVSYRNFLNATDSGNVAEIIKTAEALRKITQVTSKMYSSCWSTMLKQAKFVGGTVNDTINTISLGACQW